MVMQSFFASRPLSGAVAQAVCGFHALAVTHDALHLCYTIAEANVIHLRKKGMCNTIHAVLST